MFFVYVVWNKKHNRIYIGQTEDVDERVRLHNDHSFKGSFTSRFDGTWMLIYKENVENRNQALKREKQLKSFRGREFVKKYIPL